MSKQIRGYKITLEEALNALPADSANSHFTVPVKATILAFKAGTLVQDAAGNYSIVTQGEWFRNGTHALPQVDAFDQLNAVGLTELKKDIMKEILAKFEPAKEETRGQEDGTAGNTGNEETQPSVEANPKRQKKSKDRTGVV